MVWISRHKRIPTTNLVDQVRNDWKERGFCSFLREPYTYKIRSSLRITSDATESSCIKTINKHLKKLILNLSCRRSQGAYHQNASQRVASYEPTSCESITLRTIELRTYHTVTCKLQGFEHISCEFASSRFAWVSQPNCIWIKISKSRLIFFSEFSILRF